MPRTTKALRYFRCVDADSQPVNLESLIRDARLRLPTVASSEWRRVDEVLRIQHLRDDEGVSVHFVRYVPGESSDTLTPGTQQPEDDEAQHPAPEGMEYKDGDFFMFCKGHDLIGCSHGMSMNHGKISEYLRFYLQLASVDELNPDGREFRFHFSTVLNLEKFRLIEKHGVSKIKFNASAYRASYNEREPETTFGKIRAAVGQALQHRLEPLDVQRELEVMENLLVEASVRLKGNTRADDLAQAEIRRIAEESLEDESVTIYTQKNEPIKASEIRMQTKVTLDKHGKSVYYDEVWRHLKIYFRLLEQDRLLGQ